MRRRDMLRSILRGLPGLALLASWRGAAAAPATSRVRPGDAGWPSEADWQRLRDTVGGRLIPVTSPLDACLSAPETCTAVFDQLRNPYYLRDQPGLTQTLGWVEPGRRARAPSPSPPGAPTTSRPRCASPASTTCAWW